MTNEGKKIGLIGHIMANFTIIPKVFSTVCDFQLLKTIS